MILATLVTSFHKIPWPLRARVQLQNPIHTWLICVFMIEFFCPHQNKKKKGKKEMFLGYLVMHRRLNSLS
jgi:hypothetical protein